MIVAIRVRGPADVKKEINDTLEMLKLKKPNNCVVLPENDSIKGMLQKAKDYITWGEINRDNLERLLFKWGRVPGGRITEEYLKEKGYTKAKFLDDVYNGKIKLKDYGIKQPFRLHPPRKGWGSVKKGFHEKGALGYRGEKINELLERML